MSLLQDLKYAFRAVRKQPMFFGVAILTLALGIGANTAIFSVVHAVLLEPVAYPSEAPDRVLVMTEKSPNWDEMSVSYANFKDWQRESRSVQRMVGYVNGQANFTGTEEAIRLLVRRVSFGYFDLMGVVPAAGRFFTEEEDVAGGPHTLILNHALWQNRFGGSRDVVGETVSLSDEPYTIIGILPPGFELAPRERAYTTLEQWADNDSARDRGNHQGLRVLARLVDGVSFEEAVSEMETITARLESEYPNSNTGIRAKVVRLNDRRVEDYRATLWMLLGAVGLVLLVACTNVANLFLARSVGRQRELAIQAALGAGRRRLVQQGLTEGVLMALVGGALGVLLAIVGLELLRGLLPEDVPRLHTVALNWQVLAYTFGVSLITGVSFGAVPAFFGSRARPADPLKEGSRSTGGRGRAGRALLVVEVALATTLLVGAALLIRSLSELTRVDPGFQTDQLLTMELGVPYSRYDGEGRKRFLREMRDNLSRLPGVRSATVGLVLPMLGSSWSSVFIVGDRPVPARADLPNSLFTPVSPEYFETFEIPLLTGRLFARRDVSDAPDVVVVNKTLADHFWPDENPIGKRLKQGWPESKGEFNPWREVVGVIGDVKQFGLDVETRMQTFMPIDQVEPFSVQVALRTETDPLSLAEPAKAAIAAMDRDIPVYDIRTMESVMKASIAPRRFTMVLLAIFSGLALVLAAIGLYGVIAYSVARRTQEIGLRMAVGAGMRDIFSLIVRQGMTLAFIGAAIGVVAAIGLTRFLQSLLFGVSAIDPISLSIVPLLLLAVAFVACAVPALAATRVNPLNALRHD